MSGCSPKCSAADEAVYRHCKPDNVGEIRCSRFHGLHTGHFRSYRVRFVHGRGGVHIWRWATSGMLVLPYTASSVGVARRRLIGDLADSGVSEGVACDAGLVVSELISNALRHATPLAGNSVMVSWELRADSITIAVTDAGAETAPRVHRPTGSSLGGRGLGIVDRLSIQWGVHDSRDSLDGDEKPADSEPQITVWAELPVEYASVPALVIASSRDA
ncbi:MAG: ATP-binding protein [Trebonia sp.]